MHTHSTGWKADTDACSDTTLLFFTVLTQRADASMIFTITHNESVFSPQLLSLYVCKHQLVHSAHFLEVVISSCHESGSFIPFIEASQCIVIDGHEQSVGFSPQPLTRGTLAIPFSCCMLPGAVHGAAAEDPHLIFLPFVPCAGGAGQEAGSGGL